MSSSYQYFLISAFTFFAITSLPLGYIASYFLLTVSYLSPWMPVWMWYAVIGLFLHAIALAASSVFGVIAALANKSHALNVSTYCLLGLMLIEIGATVQLSTRKTSLDNDLQSEMKGSMQLSQTYYSFNISDTQMWDEIQLEVNCCGVKSYEDWFSTKFGNGTSVPDSCCLLITVGCGADVASKTEPEDEIITEGCLPTLMTSLRKDFNHYGYSFWLPVVGVQTILILTIIYLVRKMKTTPSYYPYVLNVPPTLLGDSLKYRPLQEPKM